MRTRSVGSLMIKLNGRVPLAIISLMTRRTYRQYCGLARSLDLLGERWTLLLVRNLLLGPQRFKDLIDGLPGIGTNLLAARLQELEQGGVISRRRLPAPAGSVVYELTARGRELEPAVLSLARWGAKLLGRPRRGESFDPGWLLLSLRALFRPEAARGIRETYELRVGGDVFAVRVDGGAVAVTRGAAQAPDLVATCDARTLLEIASRNLSMSAATKSGKLRIAGPAAGFQRLQSMFALPRP